MNHDIRIKGKLRLYFQWPALMVILLLAINAWIYMTDRKAGFVMSICVAIYAILVVVIYAHSNSKIASELMGLAAEYGMAQNVLLKEFSIPYAILTEE